MNPKSCVFTSESVTDGHPDKVADQISDGVLDAIIAKDPHCRVACETLVTTGMAVVAGEITTDTYVEIPDIVREVVKDIGYTEPSTGFAWGTCAVLVSIGRQSRDIAQGVDRGGDAQGAGDQGLMFGFACDETEELMPMPITLAHRLTRRLREARVNGVLPWLRPDGKSQVTVRYDEAGKPVHCDAIVVSAHHAEKLGNGTIDEGIREEVIKKMIPAELITAATKIFVNPTGRFEHGGPAADTGLTGRKIIVDTYGGMGHHGGGAFSGKDPSKVDRSASYMARYIAKNIVGAKLAHRCEVQVAYAIGVAEPVSVMVDTFGTGAVPDARIAAAVRDTFDLRPAVIIRALDLLRPIYRRTAAFGHFGRTEPEFTWERIDKADALRKRANG